MTKEALLAAAEQVLQDAIRDAEFSGKPKDVQYCQIVADKVEALRAELAGRVPVKLHMEYANHRMACHCIVTPVLSPGGVE